MEVPEEPSLDSDRRPVASPMVVICRICLSTRQHMISIHSTVPEYDQKTLFTMLLSVCLPLNERETVPGLPEQICRNCKWKLLSAYDLYEMTLASDEQLRTQSGASDVGDDREQGTPKVTIMLGTNNVRQNMPRNMSTGLKRPFSNLEENSNDHQTRQKQAEKKNHLGCIKQEVLDDECDGEMSFGSTKINESSNTFGEGSRLMDTTEEGATNQSSPDADEAKDAMMEAFFQEHYQVEPSSGNHVCGLCKQDFAYKSQCRIHIVQKHDPAKPFKCDVCFCTLTSHHRLVRHKIVSHGVGQMKDEDAIKSPSGSNGEVTYTCPICRKVFTSSVRFKRHKSVHVAHKRPFKCEVCLYRFATKPQLTQHAKVHEPKSPSATSAGSPGPDGSGRWYECDRCEETFPGKRARTMHLKKVHQVYQLPGLSGQRSDEREKSEYVCIICKASFARETVLNTHMKMHELLAAEKEKEKRVDLEKLVKQELQQQMMLKVPPLPPLSPEVVDRSNHVLEPFVLGLVPVAKAGAGGNSNNNNNNNNINNNESAASVLPDRGTASGQPALPGTLKQKELPKSDIAYVCTICEKEFDDRELLKKHQKEAHPKLNVDIVSSKIGGGSANDGWGSGRVIVPIGKSPLPRLTAKPGLNVRLWNGSHRQMSKTSGGSSPMEYAEDHENDSNGMQTVDDGAAGGVKSTPFRCELCHKTFPYKCYLAMHMRKNHDKSKPYGCKVCHYRFGYRGTLLRHQLVHSSQNVRPGGHGSIIFKCRICSAKFLELKQLNLHLKAHRKPTDDLNRKVQLIQCHQCSQIFSNRAQFRLHMEIEHGQEMGVIVDHDEPQSSSFRRHLDADEFCPDQHPIDESSMSLLPVAHSSSPLTDLKLLPESREENDESFLGDLSIIKIESNFEQNIQQK